MAHCKFLPIVREMAISDYTIQLKVLKKRDIALASLNSQVKSNESLPVLQRVDRKRKDYGHCWELQAACADRRLRVIHFQLEQQNDSAGWVCAETRRELRKPLLTRGEVHLIGGPWDKPAKEEKRNSEKTKNRQAKGKEEAAGISESSE